MGYLYDQEDSCAIDVHHLHLFRKLTDRVVICFRSGQQEVLIQIDSLGFRLIIHSHENGFGAGLSHGSTKDVLGVEWIVMDYEANKYGTTSTHLNNNRKSTPIAEITLCQNVVANSLEVKVLSIERGEMRISPR